MSNSSSNIAQRSRSESRVCGAPTCDLEAPIASDTHSREDQDNEELSEHSDEARPSSLGSVKHVDQSEATVITSIRATNVAIGLRRIPASFYVKVQHNGLEWRTTNKRASVNTDVVEWAGPIPIPSDPSATVHLEIYASFEFQPILGNGELLRTLAPTVDRLLDHSSNDVPFTFFPKDGDVASPCSSLFVTVGRWRPGSGDLSEPMVLYPPCVSMPLMIMSLSLICACV
jgi:hypothetical protein